MHNTSCFGDVLVPVCVRRIGSILVADSTKSGNTSCQHKPFLLIETVPMKQSKRERRRKLTYSFLNDNPTTLGCANEKLAIAAKPLSQFAVLKFLEFDAL